MNPAILAGVALAAFLADRVTKEAVRSLPLNQPRPFLDDLVYLTHTQNTGMAFSLGANFGGLFLLFAVAAVVGIAVAYPRVPPGEMLMRVAMGLILGGAVGNAFDRVVAQSVTDFIDLRFWPVFNIADSCIVVGALLLAWRLGRPPKEA